MPFSNLNNLISRKQIKIQEAITVPKVPQTFGEHMLKVRIDRNLKRGTVAKEIGVTAIAIRAWELGKSVPEMPEMKKAIAFLGYYPFPKPLTLGEHLLRYRRLHGLSIKELSELLEVNVGSISLWERGMVTPVPDTMQKIEELIYIKELSI